jgi:FtsZ-binding cell division protein ZapB
MIVSRPEVLEARGLADTKLLLIELNVLRVEVEKLREIQQQALHREEFLSASINQIKESRDQWRGEAERLHALITEPAPEQMGRCPNSGHHHWRMQACRNNSAAWRCWRRSGAPRHRVSAAKRTPSGETAWGPEVRQFRLWAEQRGCGGMGGPPGPPKLHYSTAHASPETITPLYSTDYLFVSFTVQAERSNSPTCLR